MLIGVQVSFPEEDVSRMRDYIGRLFSKSDQLKASGEHNLRNGNKFRAELWLGHAVYLLGLGEMHSHHFCLRDLEEAARQREGEIQSIAENHRLDVRESCAYGHEIPKDPLRYRPVF